MEEVVCTVVSHADVLHHSARCRVARHDEDGDLAQAELTAAMRQGSQGCLGRIATAPYARGKRQPLSTTSVNMALYRTTRSPTKPMNKAMSGIPRDVTQPSSTW